jgi:hypothetical protein
MSQQNKLLTEVEVQKIANSFLSNKYFDSKITFIGYPMADSGGEQIYKLYGEITMHSRGFLSRFTGPKSTNTFKFEIEIDARQGKIINYEIT